MIKVVIFTLFLSLYIPFECHALTNYKIGIAANFSEISTNTSNGANNEVYNALMLALKEKSAPLAKHNVVLDVVKFDYGSDAKSVIKVANEAVASDVIAVLGYNNSQQALLAAPIHQKGKLPMITASATANRLMDFDGFVHTGTVSNQQMSLILTSFVKYKLKASSASIIAISDCAYCADLAETINSSFTNLGGRIVSKHLILESQTNFESIFKEIRAQHPTVVFLPNYSVQSARIISRMIIAGIDVPVVGADGWDNIGEAFAKISFSKNVNGIYVTHWSHSSSNPINRKFIQHYKKVYNKEPDTTSALPYDSASVLLNAILSLKKIDREGIENALNATKGFDGALGHSVWKKGHVVAQSLVFHNLGKEKEGKSSEK